MTPCPRLLILCLIFILSPFVHFLFAFISFFSCLKTPICPSVSLSNSSHLFIFIVDKHLDLDATLCNLTCVRQVYIMNPCQLLPTVIESCRGFPQSLRTTAPKNATSLEFFIYSPFIVIVSLNRLH